jgi:CRISPR-associated Cas5-like protein
MKAFQLKIEGNWAHFKKPETNNNPLTHDFITKTALIGLIGAVLGKERTEMRPLFPQLSDDILYGLKLLKPVKKESWGFTLRKAVNLFEYDNFVKAVKNNEAMFTPVLGLHNCPANLYFLSEGEFSPLQNGKFVARCFVSKPPTHKIIDLSVTRQFRVGLDKMPTFQNNDFWNIPEKYREIIYPSANCEITVEGEHYIYNQDGECWWLM